MLRIYGLSIAFVLGVTSIQAQADDPYQPVNLPACKVFKTTAGKEVCGFENIDDWKAILHVDAELTHVRAQLQAVAVRTLDLEKKIDLLNTQISAYAQNQLVLSQRDDKLTKELIDLDKKYQDERVKPRWGNPVAWTIAGVSTAILAGFVINSALN